VASDRERRPTLSPGKKEGPPPDAAGERANVHCNKKSNSPRRTPQPESSDWPSVSAENPCPVCKQTNGCVRRPGGDTVRCLHAQGFVEGWEIRVANTTSGATVYRRIGANRNAAACSPIPSARPRPKPVLTKLSDVKPERVEWLWADRIPLGKLTLVAGDPGLGKSLVTCDIAARVSSGTPWPDRKSELGVAGSVILLSAEDDAADTIVPRLMAAGAIRENIRTLSGIVNLDGTRAVFTLEHGLQPLEIALNRSSRNDA